MFDKKYIENIHIFTTFFFSKLKAKYKDSKNEINGKSCYERAYEVVQRVLKINNL